MVIYNCSKIIVAKNKKNRTDNNLSVYVIYVSTILEALAGEGISKIIDFN